ncbi:MAG: LuxR C-terminal-related transcriptional regulator [Chthoniobacterales bacterium]
MLAVEQRRPDILVRMTATNSAREISSETMKAVLGNTKEIADALGISLKTVADRLLMRRLKVHNVPDLVRFAIRTGLVSADV